jgi:hypothetical protein
VGQFIRLHGKRFEPSLINPKSPGDLIKRWLRAHGRAILLHPEDAAQVATKELKSFKIHVLCGKGTKTGKFVLNIRDGFQA